MAAFARAVRVGGSQPRALRNAARVAAVLQGQAGVVRVAQRAAARLQFGETREAAMIPEGDYVARIVGAYLGYDNWGREAAKLDMEIKGGAQHGCPLSWAGGFEGEWLGRTLSSLRACGFLGVDLALLSQLVGKDVNVSVKHKESKRGTVYLQVFVNQRKVMDQATSASFAANMKRVLASVEEEQPAGEAPPEKPKRQRAKKATVPPVCVHAFDDDGVCGRCGMDATGDEAPVFPEDDGIPF